MACPDRLSQWKQEVSTALPHLSKTQCWGLVLWSAGIALAKAAGLEQVSALLSALLEEKPQAVFQRLREWYLDKEQKTGEKRREVEVMRCFGPLLCWVVRLIQVKPGEKRRLALALDATSLRNQWTILAVSVLVAGCAIPVAWKVLPAHQRGSWRPYWETMLACLGEAVPTDWEVVVMADRGLYARWIWDAVVALGWHPFLRINTRSQAREVGSETFFGLSHWVPSPGTSWAGKMDCFASKNSRLVATVLMHWEPGYEDAWIILTDLDPQQARLAWYRLRTWTLGGFKDLKRGLWGWHHSKMDRASCVERLWLALALAQLWCVRMPMPSGKRTRGDVEPARAGSGPARDASRPPITHSSCRPAPASPSELCLAWTSHPARHAVSRQGALSGDLASGCLARGDASSTKTGNEKEKSYEDRKGERAAKRRKTPSMETLPCSALKNLYV